MIKVIKFSASWCVPCRYLKPVFEEIKTIEKYSKFQFVDYDIDEEYEMTKKYNVRSVPTVIIFKDDLEIERINGYDRKEVYINKLDKYV